ELSALVRADPRFASCALRSMFRNAVGVIEGVEQGPGFAPLDESFVDSGHNYKAAMAELTVSPLFRLVEEPK
nr:hypothetical protein [Deltaproteobacteria bacterium]